MAIKQKRCRSGSARRAGSSSFWSPVKPSPSQSHLWTPPLFIRSVISHLNASQAVITLLLNLHLNHLPALYGAGAATAHSITSSLQSSIKGRMGQGHARSLAHSLALYLLRSPFFFFFFYCSSFASSDQQRSLKSLLCPCLSSERSALGRAHRPPDEIHRRHAQPVLAAPGQTQRGHPGL